MNTDPGGLMVPLEEEWVGDHYDQSDGPNYAGCGGCQDGELETDPTRRTAQPSGAHQWARRSR